MGYGLAGRTFHAPLVASVDGMRLSTVVTSDPGRAAQVRADHPGARVVPDVDTLLAHADDHDIVVVATVNSAHVHVATAALEAGLPVVVDKPLANTSREAQALVDLAATKQLLLTVFQDRRLDSDQRTLRRLLAHGELGTVLRYESRFERWRPVLTAAKWRETTPASEGGGMLLDLGSHVVDQAIALFGAVNSVYAEVAARRGGADDDAFVALRHANGVLSHLWVSSISAAPGPRLRVLGTQGAYLVDGVDGQGGALRSGRTPRDPGGVRSLASDGGDSCAATSSPSCRVSAEPGTRSTRPCWQHYATRTRRRSMHTTPSRSCAFSRQRVPAPTSVSSYRFDDGLNTNSGSIGGRRPHPSSIAPRC